MTIEAAANQLATRLDIPTPDGESLAGFRLSFARLQRIGDLKTELLRLAASRTLRARYPDGGYLPEDSMISESSQVDISEAQTALEVMGWTFVSIESAASSGALESVEPPVKAPANITRNRLRIDSLDAPIEKAIKQAGCLDTATVFTHLKELALNGEALPFTGVFEGAALCYTNDSDMPGTLTKNALDKRLAKRRKVTA